VGAANLSPELHDLRGRLVDWLVHAAYPVWARCGIDPLTGCFFETLDRNGRAVGNPPRARTQPRQLYAFSRAQAFGWGGDTVGIVRRGLHYFLEHYRRSDGLFRTLVDINGIALDDRALLYDQAFALLGLAAAAVVLDSRKELEHRALELRVVIEEHLGAGEGAFFSEEQSTELRESNPHMHLLEACLAWAEIGQSTEWADWVRGLVDLALSRFIRKDSGALGESYLANWKPTPGAAGHVIEPGHQFEWAWLLLRCERLHPGPLRSTALRLIAIGDDFGVHQGVAINALYDDFRVKDGNARFWPQTERLKASLLAATLTGMSAYWSMAHSAATSFLPYLNTPVTGLWFDEQLSSGGMIRSSAPASTFYHLVGAIEALGSMRVIAQ
jgi:mannose/cellobiose epimerase-like protein (N-acyl-D-glucosamine 2-epimerase family)